jgi:hypothetical protein
MDDPIADGMNAVGNLLDAEPVKNLLESLRKKERVAPTERLP